MEPEQIGVIAMHAEACRTGVHYADWLAPLGRSDRSAPEIHGLPFDDTL